MEAGKEILGEIDVRGIVTGVTPASEFSRSNARGRVVQDYYHVFIVTKKGNTAKIYFPVSTCTTNQYSRNRSIDIFVRDNRDDNWIKYPLKNPKLLTGKIIEVHGNVKKEGDRNYYVNRITKIKIF